MARNNLEFPEESGPLDDSWRTPLTAFVRQMPVNAYSRFFDEQDLMIMARIVRGSRPSITLYKHRLTRHYLNLDDVGRTYRYVPPRGAGDGRYLLQPDVEAALEALGLWELPWMKEGLESFRRGLAWEDRWRLHPDEEWRDDEDIYPNASNDNEPNATGGARVYCFKTRRRTS